MVQEKGLRDQPFKCGKAPAREDQYADHHSLDSAKWILPQGWRADCIDE